MERKEGREEGRKGGRKEGDQGTKREEIELKCREMTSPQ
jgi:hypothetical protein